MPLRDFITSELKFFIRCDTCPAQGVAIGGGKSNAAAQFHEQGWREFPTRIACPCCVKKG